MNDLGEGGGIKDFNKDESILDKDSKHSKAKSKFLLLWFLFFYLFFLPLSFLFICSLKINDSIQFSQAGFYFCQRNSR